VSGLRKIYSTKPRRSWISIEIEKYNPVFRSADVHERLDNQPENPLQIARSVRIITTQRKILCTLRIYVYIICLPKIVVEMVHWI
jgi:hypothetical protein